MSERAGLGCTVLAGGRAATELFPLRSDAYTMDSFSPSAVGFWPFYSGLVYTHYTSKGEVKHSLIQHMKHCEWKCWHKLVCVSLPPSYSDVTLELRLRFSRDAWRGQNVALQPNCWDSTSKHHAEVKKRLQNQPGSARGGKKIQTPRT